MISEWQVLGWLNRYGASQLSSEYNNQIRLIRAAHLPEDDKLKILDNLVAIAQTLTNVLERAELEANCGLLYSARGIVLESNRLLRSAENIYKQYMYLHHQAIVEWLLFIVDRGQGNHQPAFYWANEARNNLWKLVKFYNQQKDERKEKWYRELVYELTSNILDTPRYVYEYLFVFRPSRLSSSAAVIKGKIEELLMDGKEEEAHTKMDFLLQITRSALDPTETAEAMAFCGLTEAEIGRPRESISLLRSALSQSVPASHEYIFTRWMLALVQYADSDYRIEAVKNMEECACAVTRLADQADQRNDQKPHLWYEIISEAMRRSMKRMVAKIA